MVDIPDWRDNLYELAADYVARAGLPAPDVEAIRSANMVRLFGVRLVHGNQSCSR
jgi:hypothetical protein